jgi:plastocyanin
MDRRLARIFALCVVMLLLGAACGGDDEPEGGATSGSEQSDEDEGGGGGTVQVAGEDANDHGSTDASGEDELKLEADDFYFSPTVITGAAGQSLTVEIENEGNAPHTFTIDDQGIDEQIEAGEDASVEVTFPDSGEVLFYCRFHQGQGMRGGLKAA